MAKDVHRWVVECPVCFRFRSTRLATGPMKSLLGDEEHAHKLPWTDVIVDIIGPFTRADTGEQYIMDYICTKLRMSKYEALINIQTGHFYHALIRCMLRSGILPEIIRSDRGSEMVSKISEAVSLARARSAGHTLVSDLLIAQGESEPAGVSFAHRRILPTYSSECGRPRGRNQRRRKSNAR